MLTQPGRRWRRIIAWASLIIAAGWVAGATATLTGLFEDEATARPEFQPSPADPAVETIMQFEDGTHVPALLWRGDEELWFVESKGDGTLVLTRYRVAGKRFDSWPVPERASQTIYTYAVLDRDGLIWVCANRTLASFDPVAEKYVSVMNLNAEPSEKVPGSPGGTWINGLVTTADGDLVLTRNNASALYKISGGGVSVLEQLAQAPSGVRLERGSAVPYRRSGSSATSLREGAVGGAFPVIGLSGNGCTFGQALGGMNIKGSSEQPIVSGLFLTSLDALAESSDGRLLAVFSPTQGAILRVDCLANLVQSFQLEKSLALPEGVPVADYSSDKELVAEPVEMPDVAESLAVSPGGVVAAGLASNRVIIIR